MAADDDADTHPPRHSVRGHVKTVVIAAAFGLGAYGVIKLLIWLNRSLGSVF